MENALRCPLLKLSCAMLQSFRGRALPVMSHWKYSFWSDNGWISSRTWTCMFPPSRKSTEPFYFGQQVMRASLPFQDLHKSSFTAWEKPYMCICAIQKAFQRCKTSLFSLFPFVFPMGTFVLGGVCGEKFQREALTEWDTAGGECVQWSHDHSAQDGAHYGEIHSVPGI